MNNSSIASLAALVAAAPPRLGATRLALVDGPAGAGKTTLANRVGAVLGAQVIHGDDLYEGWEGLDTLWPFVHTHILEPLARGEGASFRRWDWVHGRRAEPIDVPVADFLVIEGVGVAQTGARGYASLVVFVDAPGEVRLARGLARDGEAMRGHWETWQLVEAALLAREGTRGAADVVIDGTTPVPDL